jgi:hypothetical protein
MLADEESFSICNNVYTSCKVDYNFSLKKSDIQIYLCSILIHKFLETCEQNCLVTEFRHDKRHRLP